MVGCAVVGQVIRWSFGREARFAVPLWGLVCATSASVISCGNVRATNDASTASDASESSDASATSDGSVTFDAVSTAEPACLDDNGTFRMDPVWHYLRLVNGPFWKTTEGAVNAIGVTGVEPWDQWYLICRRPTWDPTHWALKSNRGAGYLQTSSASDRVTVGSGIVTNEWQLFQICDLEGNIKVVRSVPTGLAVSARHDESNTPLRASATSVGESEQFVAMPSFVTSPCAP